MKKQLTRMAIERATDALNLKIHHKMEAWAKKNPPPPSADLSLPEAIKLALKDPEWAPNIIARAAYGPPYLSLDILIQDSPKVKHVQEQRWTERDATAVKRITRANDEEKEKYGLHVRKSELLNRAIIGGMTPRELLAEIEAF
jgi:hypothetical protein